MKVALFSTCLIDMFRPSAGFATLELLEAAGCQVEVPLAQTCCGQPAYNNGDRNDTIRIARQVIDTFNQYDYVIIPSGSCAGMLSRHYPELFADDSLWSAKARIFASKCYELTVFLHDILRLETLNRAFHAEVVYHDSCSSLREAGSHNSATRLLENTPGLRLHPLEENQVCCGFGGTFSIKFPSLSTRMVDDKISFIRKTPAEVVTATDLGCLMNISGRLRRLSHPVRALHIAEILAGKTDLPGIAESEENS